MRSSTFPTLISALAALALTGGAIAGEINLTAELDTDTVRVGDRVTLTVRAEHDAAERVALENLDRPPVITVWDVDEETEALGEDRRRTTLTYSLSSFVVGQHRVATNELLVLGADNSQRSEPMPVLLLNVDSVLSNPPPALAEIRRELPLPGNRWLKILGILLIVLAVGALLALFVIRWIRRPDRPDAARVLPPHDVAFAALDALMKRGYIEAGDVEPFYVELSSIVRVYLEERFDLHAPEQTTEEFIRDSASSNELSLEHRQLTQDFLEQSDLVKFARHEPSSDDMKAACDAAARLVRETIPAESPTEGAS